MTTAPQEQPHAGLLAQTTGTPVAQLSPLLDNTIPRHIKAEVALIWPYSSSTKTFTLLLADPDFRLRRANGQVRVEFHGPSAKAVASSRVGIGDVVLLSLDCAEWTRPTGGLNTPGKGVDWDLRFGERVVLEVHRDFEHLATVNVDYPPQRSPLEATSPSTQTLQTPIRNGGLVSTIKDAPELWSSPAFLKHARLPSGSFLDASLEPFAEEDGFIAEKGRKRTRFGRRSDQWSFSARTPSPTKDDAGHELSDTSEDVPAEVHVPTVDTAVESGRTEQALGLTSPPATEAVETPRRLDSVPRDEETVEPTVSSRPQEQSVDVDVEMTNDDGVISIEQKQHSESRTEEQDGHVPGEPSRTYVREDTESIPEEEQRLGDGDQTPKAILTPRLAPLASPGLPLVSPLILRTGPSSSYFSEPSPSRSELDAISERVDVERTNIGQTQMIDPASQGSIESLAGQAGETFEIQERRLDGSEMVSTTAPSLPLHDDSDLNQDEIAHGSPAAVIQYSEEISGPQEKLPLRDKLPEPSRTQAGDAMEIEASSVHSEAYTSDDQPNDQLIINEAATRYELDEEDEETDLGEDEGDEDIEDDEDVGEKREEGLQIEDVEGSDEEAGEFERETWREPAQTEGKVLQPPEIIDLEEEEEEEEEGEEEVRVEHEEGGYESPVFSPSLGAQSAPINKELQHSQPTKIQEQFNTHEPDLESTYSTSATQVHYPAIPIDGAASPQHEPTTESTLDPRLQNQLITPNLTQQTSALSQPSSISLTQEPALPTPQNTQSFTEVSQPPMPPPTLDGEELTDKLAQVRRSPRLTRHRLSNDVPDVVRPWFAPRRSSQRQVTESESEDEAEEKEKINEIQPKGEAKVTNKHLFSESTPLGPPEEPKVVGFDKTLQESAKLPIIQPSPPKSFSTRLTYFAPLSTLPEYFSWHVDTFSVVASSAEIKRASKGPRDYFTTLHLIDPSSHGRTTAAQIFRPYKKALPRVKDGEVVLLRDCKVQSTKGQTMLLSTDSSAWAVFGTNGGEIRIDGPPVEFGAEERGFAKGLSDWWLSEGEQTFKDAEARRKAAGDGIDVTNGSSNRPSQTQPATEIDGVDEHNASASPRARAGLAPINKTNHRESPVADEVMYELRDGTKYIDERRPSTSASDLHTHELRGGVRYPDEPPSSPTTRKRAAIAPDVPESKHVVRDDTKSTEDRRPSTSSSNVHMHELRGGVTYSDEPPSSPTTRKRAANLRDGFTTKTKHELRDGSTYPDDADIGDDDGDGPRSTSSGGGSNVRNAHELRDGVTYTDEPSAASPTSTANPTTASRRKSIVYELRDGVTYRDEPSTMSPITSSANPTTIASRRKASVHELRDGTTYTDEPSAMGPTTSSASPMTIATRRKASVHELRDGSTYTDEPSTITSPTAIATRRKASIHELRDGSTYTDEPSAVTSRTSPATRSRRRGSKDNVHELRGGVKYKDV